MNLHFNIDSKISFICGLMGGTTKYLLFASFIEVGERMLEAILTAFFCGMAGVLGKHVLEFIKKQFKNKK